MRWLLGKILCVAGLHNWIVSLQFGRPAIRYCRRCALVVERD